MQSKGFFIGVFQGDTVTLPVTVLAQGEAIDLAGFTATLVINAGENEVRFSGVPEADNKRIAVRLSKSDTRNIPVGTFPAWLIVESDEFKSSHPGQITVSPGSDSGDYGESFSRSVIERFPGRINAEQPTITVYSMLF